MSAETPDSARIAELEARVAALERALRRRSRQLREIQRCVCSADLLAIDAIAAGRAPAAQFEGLDGWEEDNHLTAADVGETLDALWAATRVARARGAGG